MSCSMSIIGPTKFPGCIQDNSTYLLSPTK